MRTMLLVGLVLGMGNVGVAQVSKEGERAFLEQRVRLLGERVSLYEERSRLAEQEAAVRSRQLQGELAVATGRIETRQAQLQAREAEFARIGLLAKNGAVTDAEVNEARIRMAVAREELAETRELARTLELGLERSKLEAARNGIDARLSTIAARLELLETRYRLEQLGAAGSGGGEGDAADGLEP